MPHSFDIQFDNKLSPYAELFRASVIAAHLEGASDVHIEPTRSGVEIRFRVLGDMQLPWKKLDLEHKHGFMTTVKKETRLQIGVSGRPQDSRCTVEGIPIDLRVNLLPTLYGEKIVLRLLDSNREFGIENLGILQPTLDDMMRALRHRNGVVLISGPTGSGKTTTLYSMLCAMDRTRKNIVTLEDPVEYTIAGINQVRIDPKVTFAAALRSVLRQDPDVILVGEIRDEETAQLAFKAASTGHLVLSTIHANGAVEVVGRLLGLGVDRMTLKENLRFSAAQRLIGKICQNCSMQVPGSVLETLISETEYNQLQTLQFRIRNTSGCLSCKEGIISRIPVIEYMDMQGIKRVVEMNPKTGNRTDSLVTSLKEAAFDLARKGLIDITEVTSIA